MTSAKSGAHPDAPASPAAPSPAGGPAERPRVSYVIGRLARAISHGVEEAAAAHGLSVSQFSVLLVIRRRDGLSNAELARQTLVQRQSVNEVLAYLESKDLIRRTPDPRHRRILRTHLTSKGAQIVEACDQEVGVLEEQMLGRLDPSQRETLDLLLHTALSGLGSDFEQG